MLLRAPQERDAEAVAELLARRDTADFGRPDYTLDDLLDDWRASQLDMARDAIVAESPQGSLAGYAIVRRLGTFAAVDPDMEEQGVGSALLDWCEARQRELCWREHRTAIAAGNVRAEALLSRRGYRVVRSNYRMVLALEGPLPASTTAATTAGIAAGVTFRALDAVSDGPALHAVDQDAFAAVASSEPEPLASFTEEHLQAHDLDQQLSRVAQRAGEIAGFALVRRWEGESAAFVDILAVDPKAQGAGIGRALLLEVFAAARRAGLAEAQLGVAADNPRALGLYERIGMRPRSQLDIYERAITGAQHGQAPSQGSP
jgi:mycothiol synthase